MHFLLNPRVKTSPLAQKRTFLLHKGLTSHEIDAAIERASSGQLFLAAPARPASGALYPSDVYGRPPSHPYTVQYDHPSIWLTTRTLVPAVAVAAGVAYGIYVFYKKYLERLLFGKQKHPLLVIQESVQKLTDSMNALRESLTSLETNIKQQIERDLSAYARPSPAEIAAMNDIKTEVLSLKALLLNRKQFPAAPRIKASIPSWQLSDEIKVVSNDRVDGPISPSNADHSDSAEYNSPSDIVSPASSGADDSQPESDESDTIKTDAKSAFKIGNGHSRMATANGHGI